MMVIRIRMSFFKSSSEKHLLAAAYRKFQFAFSGPLLLPSLASSPPNLGNYDDHSFNRAMYLTAKLIRDIFIKK
jgi:hypothetical protein